MNSSSDPESGTDPAVNKTLVDSDPVQPDPDSADSRSPEGATAPKEQGGPKGLEPTRYGDWERKGRCIDF